MSGYLAVLNGRPVMMPARICHDELVKLARDMCRIPDRPVLVTYRQRFAAFGAPAHRLAPGECVDVHRKMVFHVMRAQPGNT